MSALRLSSMFLIVAVASLLLVTPTFGELPLRVRGTIIAKDDRHIRVKERDGRFKGEKDFHNLHSSGMSQLEPRCRPDS